MMVTGAVPVGPGTLVGFGVGGLAFVEACVRIALGDATADDTGTVVQGIMGGLLLIVTVVGRQWQAGQTVKATAGVEAAKASAVTYTSFNSASGTLLKTEPPVEGEPVDSTLEFPGGSVPTGVGPEAVERLHP